MIKTIERKVGLNRGKARLWIEGDSLASMNWIRGKRYNVTFTDGLIMLSANDEGKRKIAGTTSRPIIDMNTDKIRQAVGDCDKVNISITNQSIMITAID